MDIKGRIQNWLPLYRQHKGKIEDGPITSALKEMSDKQQGKPKSLIGSELADLIYSRRVWVAFLPTGGGGVFDYFEIVYTNDDEKLYEEEMGEAYLTTSKGKLRDVTSKKHCYRTYWRTFQMSDHLPMWIQFKTVFGRENLEKRRCETLGTH